MQIEFLCVLSDPRILNIKGLGVGVASLAIRFNPPPGFFASHVNWQSMCLSFASTLLWLGFGRRERGIKLNVLRRTIHFPINWLNYFITLREKAIIAGVMTFHFT